MSSKKKPQTPTHKPSNEWKRTAHPDAVDFRDREFIPRVAQAPQSEWFPTYQPEVKNQGDTNACTGFALSIVVEYLLHASKREAKPAVSEFMLYSMARRYDEFPGTNNDEGSSARGALKGWFKYGVCARELFPKLEMPPAKPKAKLDQDWWFDAITRPLGAYFRVKTDSLSDMHAAINEVGALFVTVGCHAGWDVGNDMSPKGSKRPRSFKDGIWQIERKPGYAAHWGHAVAIVGYNQEGFLIQNSWGPEWGSHGYAILTYDDWLSNAMDCWAAQLGVVTSEHKEMSRSLSLRETQGKQVVLASNPELANREIAPFIINVANNGRLSNGGDFRTSADDIRALFDVQLKEARERWQLKPKEPIRVCIYAHGGLVGEKAAAKIAKRWIPALYERQIFPVFLMWETGLFDTLLNIMNEHFGRESERAGGFSETVKRWWNERLERMLARPGYGLWAEMKENAQAIGAWATGSDIADNAGHLLYEQLGPLMQKGRAQVHLVAHSAGSIVAAELVDAWHRRGKVQFESMSFMAPALRVDEFDKKVRPHLKAGRLPRFQQFHLTSRAESDDPTCGPYRRSLLYLVSEAFEGGRSVPIVGMQDFWDSYVTGAALPNATAYTSPTMVGSTTQHGGFDEDLAIQARILDFIAPAP
jgi:hypothetical protein